MTKKTRAKARRALLTLSLVLVMMTVAVGGTIAWLSDNTDAVVNTFSPSELDIELKEYDLKADGTLDLNAEVTSEDGYLMIPGKELPKQPFARVKANSEKLYLFIKPTEQNNTFTDAAGNTKVYLQYTVDTTIWTAVPGYTGMYYKVIDKSTSDQQFDILTGDKVTVNSAITKAEMDNVTDDTKPTLSFDAFAVQYDIITEAEAFELAATDLGVTKD